MEDDAIVNLFWLRQESAITKSQEKYGKRIYSTAKNILQNDEDAKECANDTLLKAWENIPPSRPNFLGAFLAKIARNLAINKWKAKRTKKRGGGEVDLLLSELQECIPDSNQVEKIYESSVIIESINSCLQDMEQSTRIIFVLRYFNGETILNISKRFGLSESNVKSKLFRARKLLKERLKREEVFV